MTPSNCLYTVWLTTNFSNKHIRCIKKESLINQLENVKYFYCKRPKKGTGGSQTVSGSFLICPYKNKLVTLNHILGQDHHSGENITKYMYEFDIKTHLQVFFPKFIVFYKIYCTVTTSQLL